MAFTPSYERSKAFLLAFGQMLYGQEWSNIVPQSVHDNEQRGTEIAQKGMRMAVADLIADSARIPYSKVSQIDEALKKNNVPTLSEMRAANTKFVKSFVKRTKIETEDEFLTLRSIIESGLIDDDDVHSYLTNMMNRYEKT